MKHESWMYKEVSGKPLIFIIGQNPGKSRSSDKKAFVGNRTGSFVMNLLEVNNLSNVYLTNVCPDEIMTEPNLLSGIFDLECAIIEKSPIYIIAFGKLAQSVVQRFVQDRNYITDKIFYLPHPSHAMRFNDQTEIGMINKAFWTLGNIQARCNHDK